MADLAWAAAALLAVVFVWAAVAKVRQRTATAASFADLGLPAPAALAVGVPVAEALVAIGLVVRPSVAAWAAVALLVGFSAVIVRALARGDAVPCACFGAAASDRVVSTADLLRNAGFAALAMVASAAPPGRLQAPAFVPAAAVLLLTAAGAALLAVYRQRISAPTVRR